jgi:hypothetical protein
VTKDVIDGTEAERVWSTKNDPLFDAADSGAAVYRDGCGQHYLAVEHWNGGQHVLRITVAEANRIIAANNYRLVLWTYMAAQIEAAEAGDWERAERLLTEMKLRWEKR